jgi:hypothetical protein
VNVLRVNAPDASESYRGYSNYFRHLGLTAAHPESCTGRDK